MARPRSHSQLRIAIPGSRIPNPGIQANFDNPEIAGLSTRNTGMFVIMLQNDI